MKKAITRIKKERLGIKELKRKNLEKKVEEGVKKAVEQYREVFKKLAEYDRA